MSARILLRSRSGLQRAAGMAEAAFARACGATLAVLLAFAVLTAAQRYLFGGAWIGAEEAMSWLLLLLVCLGFPAVAGGRLSMRIDLFGQGTGMVHEARAIVAETIVLAAGLALLSAGARAAAGIGGISPLLGLGEWMRPFALALSGGAAVLLRGALLIGNGEARRLAPALAAAILLSTLASIGAPLINVPPSLVAGTVIAAGILSAAPLPHSFILAGHLALIAGSPLVEPALATALLDGMGRYLLLAIPFFLLAGGLLLASRLADDLVRFAAALVGARRAALGQTVLVTSLLFSGISGSSIANAAFSAKTFLLPLTRHGYSPERAGAILAATAVLDNIVPPSIAFFILAAAANLPVGPLLVGGLVAGLALAVALAISIHFSTPPVAQAPHEPMRPGLALRALPVFGLGLIVVFGIRLGLVTPAEAAALAASYTLVAALLSRGGTGRIASAFIGAGTETAAILILIGAAVPLAMLLAIDGIAPAAARIALALGDHKLPILLASNLLLLAVGLFLDIGAAILLFAPLLLPVAMAAGIDPVGFGVLIVVNLMIGGLTPPVGILVQVVSATGGIAATRLFRAVLPHLAALLVALAALSAAVAYLS